MKRLILLLALVCLPGIARAQIVGGAGGFNGGNIGSNSSPVISSIGQPIPGVNIAICQPMLTSTAAVANNLATLTMTGNPLSSGYLVGKTLVVTGFTGADVYFNGSFTIASVSPTTISYSLVAANASATTVGSALQQGDSLTPCAALAPIFSDPTLTIPLAQPLSSDGVGNWNAYATPGVYSAQFYGPNIATTIKQYSIACVPGSAVGGCGAVTQGGNNVWTGLNTFSQINGAIVVDGATYPQTIVGINSALAVAACTRPVILPAAVYSGTVPVTITCNSQRLIGAGRNESIINFTGIGVAVSFVAPTTSVWDSSGAIEDLGITGASTATDAIYVTDTVGLKLSGLKISGFNGTSGTAIHLDNTGATGQNFTERTIVDDVELTDTTNWARFTVTGSNNSFAYTDFENLRGQFDVVNGVGLSFENNADIEQGYFKLKGNVNASGTTFYKLTGTATVGNGNWFIHQSEIDLGGSYTIVNAAAGTLFQPNGLFSAFGSPAITGAGAIYFAMDQSLTLGNLPFNIGQALFLNGSVLISALHPTFGSAGFGTGAVINALNGTGAFEITLGTGNTGSGLISMPTAIHGWNCTATDNTTTSADVFITKVVPTSTTSITLQNYTDTATTGDWVDGDIISVSCGGGGF